MNGRKINLISLDDGYSPPKTVEQIRRLVEQEQVAFIFNTLGTAPNLAIRQYLNDNKVPQLFVATGASLFNDPEHFPWTVGFNPNYQTEAQIFAKHILATKPDAKIAMLYQNDGFGKDYLIGLKEALGAEHAGMLVRRSYETSEPSVDSQIVPCRQRRRCPHHRGDAEIRCAGDPQILRSRLERGALPQDVSPSIATVLKPAGLEKSKGLITGSYVKDATDSRWKDDPGMKDWKAFCDKYLTSTDFSMQIQPTDSAPLKPWCRFSSNAATT